MSLDTQLHYTNNMSSLSVHVHQCLQELVENGVGLSVLNAGGMELGLTTVAVLSTVEWDFGFQEQQP